MNESTKWALDQFEAAADVMAAAAKAIEAVGSNMKNDTSVKASEVAEYYFYVREIYERADKALKVAYHTHDMMNKHLIPERMQAEGVDGIKVPSIARSFSIVAKTSASFLDKEQGYEWLRTIGQGDIIQETVNAGTLSAFCRNLVLEQGIEPPADLIKMSTYNTTGMVKYRPKVSA